MKEKFKYILFQIHVSISCIYLSKWDVEAQQEMHCQERPANDTCSSKVLQTSRGTTQ